MTTLPNQIDVLNPRRLATHSRGGGMTANLVASILTADSAGCNFNRSVILMVRDHPIDMREDDATAALKHIVVDDDIRLELEGLRGYIDDALRY